jgi:hypothetical protein
MACSVVWVKLRGEHGLRVFENRVLRRIFGRNRMKQQEAEENCIVGSFSHY